MTEIELITEELRTAAADLKRKVHLLWTGEDFLAEFTKHGDKDHRGSSLYQVLCHDCGEKILDTDEVTKIPMQGDIECKCMGFD